MAGQSFYKQEQNEQNKNKQTKTPNQSNKHKNKCPLGRKLLLLYPETVSTVVDI